MSKADRSICIAIILVASIVPLKVCYRVAQDHAEIRLEDRLDAVNNNQDIYEMDRSEICSLMPLTVLEKFDCWIAEDHLLE